MRATPPQRVKPSPHPIATHPRTWRQRLENAEASLAQRLEAEQRSGGARLEEAKQRAAVERAAVEEKWAAASAEAEARWRSKLEELRSKCGAVCVCALGVGGQGGHSAHLPWACPCWIRSFFAMRWHPRRGRWAGEQASADAAWAARLEEAHQRWLRERGELERGAADKLAAVQEVAAARYDALRAQLEARVAGIGERLATLASKEGRKDAAAKELRREVRVRQRRGEGG